MKAFLLVLTTALLLPTALNAASARPEQIDAYLAQLAAVDAATTPTSLEPLFAAAEDIQSALMKLSGDKAWIETLDDAEFTALKAELRGLLLNRGLDVYAQPDPRFLLDLAEQKGRKADQEFFRRYRQSLSADYFPVTLNPGLRRTPCVRFNERLLPEVYEMWQRYADSFAGAYRGFVQQSLRDVEEMIALGTCACGDQASVEAELKNWVRRFPDSAANAPARKRLQQLKNDPYSLPINCN